MISTVITGCFTEEKPPVIHADRNTFEVISGDTLYISFECENAQHGEYVWRNSSGEVISTAPGLEYVSEKAGREYITFTVTNSAGKDEVEIRVDTRERSIPEITIPGAEYGFETVVKNDMTIIPVVSSVLPVTYEWLIDGLLYSRADTLLFKADVEGVFRVTLTVANEEASDSEEFDIRVTSPEEATFRWTFIQEEYNLSRGRKILVGPVDIENDFDALYTWYVDGVEVQKKSSPSFVFYGEEEGRFSLTVNMSNGYLSANKELVVNVAPPEGTFRRDGTGNMRADRIFEYSPAPGQFINEGYTATTMDQACEYARQRVVEEEFVSLGGFGGYIVAGFDHSIPNNGSFDLRIGGNSHEGGSEPGIIYVMQDENGDGLPNDTWFELKGSEYGKAETISDYAVTYYRPASAGEISVGGITEAEAEL